MPTHLQNESRHTHTHPVPAVHKPQQVSFFTEHIPAVNLDRTINEKGEKGGKVMTMVYHFIVSIDSKQHMQLAAAHPDAKSKGWVLGI